MKKIILFASIFFISSIISYAEIPKKFQGTYLPVNYISALKKYKTHIKALKENKKIYYDAICITEYNGEDTIFSNLGFHDQYAIDEAELMHNWKNKDLKIITDKKNNKYIKISNGTHYYDEIRKFISKEIFSKQKYEKDNIKFEVLKNGNVKFKNNEYRLNLDYMFRNEQYDEFYSKQGQTVKYIIVKQTGEKLIISELEKEFPDIVKTISSYELF